MTDSALTLLGLALRGNNLAVGEEPVADACKTGRARLVLTAADAAENSAGRARRWAEAANVPWIPAPWGKEPLGGALGRASCAMAALTDPGLAAALAKRLADADGKYQPLWDRLARETPRKPRPTKKSRGPKSPLSVKFRRWPV